MGQIATVTVGFANGIGDCWWHADVAESKCQQQGSRREYENGQNTTRRRIVLELNNKFAS